jgi:VIT1/CCC1 family predicted Fe2+/Mn2+ transporter
MFAIINYMRHRKKISADYLHSGFFGIEDSLVSTTGALAGIAISSTSKAAIISAALVIIAVESTSMAASEFVSEETEEDVENTKNPASPLISGLIIFIGYIIAGMIPLAPYLLLPKLQAIPVSIGLALTGLFLLGIYKGKISHKSPLRSALEVLIIGGVAAGIGIAVGLIFKV